MIAFINSDPNEDPSILSALFQELRENYGATPVLTNKRPEWHPEPYIWLRNPYMKINFKQILHFAKFHEGFGRIFFGKELVYVDHSISQKYPPFVFNGKLEHKVPAAKPLPILLITHRRPLLLKMAWRSLMAVKHEAQDIFVLASSPCGETLQFLNDEMWGSASEIVYTEENLGYCVGMFAIKYFGLKKFIHFEDDFIIPENIDFFAPYWNRQLNYRSGFSLAGIRTSVENVNPNIIHLMDMSAYPINGIWGTYPYSEVIPPFGGNGLVVDVDIAYKGAEWFRTDLEIFRQYKSLSLLNIPIFHSGATIKSGGGGKVSLPPKEVEGIDLKTKARRTIKLGPTL